MNKRAIVIADDHYNALGMVRSLGENDIEVNLILTTESKNTYVDKSKYVAQCIKVSPNEEAIVNAIRLVVKSTDNYYVFPLSDYTAELIDNNWDKFSNNICVPHAKGQLNSLMDKSEIKRIAEDCGLSVPISKVIVLE